MEWFGTRELGSQRDPKKNKVFLNQEWEPWPDFGAQHTYSSSTQRACVFVREDIWRQYILHNTQIASEHMLRSVWMCTCCVRTFLVMDWCWEMFMRFFLIFFSVLRLSIRWILGFLGHHSEPRRHQPRWAARCRVRETRGRGTYLCFAKLFSLCLN